MAALLFALPIIISDALLMVPDFSSAPFVYTVPDETPARRESALALGSRKRPGWTITASLFQRIKIGRNPAQGMPAWQELVVILVGHLAEEAFARACLLGGLTGWVTDRLFEADAFDGDAVQSQAAAPVIALSLIIFVEALRKRRALLRTLPTRAVLMKRDASGVARPMEEGDTSGQVFLDEARGRAATLAQLEAFRDLAEWVCFGGVYVKTQNLFCRRVSQDGE